MTKEMNEEMKDATIYEVGYHLVPTLAEEALPAQIEAIKSIITVIGGEIISEGAPQMKTLAYPIAKTVKATKSNYSKAYFGWIKFSITPDAIGKIKISLDASDVVIRHLIISTIKESTLIADKEKRPVRPDGAKEKVNEEEIDKSIDELVVS